VSTLIVGCGYLGQRLGALLLRGGEPVWGTVRSPSRAEELARSGIEPVIADVLHPESLRRLPRADHVFYCVGFDRSAGAAMRAVLVDGFQHVLDRLSHSVQRMVYASSTGVYGQTDGEWVDEESPACPGNESGKVILEAEGRLRAWAQATTRLAIVLRFAGLYGPGRIVRRALLERGEPIPGDPERFLNLIHIEDAARVAGAALQALKPDRIYLVGDDRPVTRREYYSVAARCLGAAEPRFAPPQPGSPEAARDATSKRVANRRMKHGLGITLLYPDISTGIPAALGSDLPPG
jgi:nucleoside-diphosphate-sugar epimerase